jgi:hypothetical protein
MDLQKIMLVLFLICGAISLFLRLRSDVSSTSTILKKSDEETWEKTQEKNQSRAGIQLIFSILTVIFLVLCILIGAGRVNGWF